MYNYDVQCHGNTLRFISYKVNQPRLEFTCQILITTITDGRQFNTKILVCNINGKYRYNMLLYVLNSN